MSRDRCYMDWNKQVKSGIGPLHAQSKENWVSTLYTLMQVYMYYAITIKGGFWNGYDPHFLCWWLLGEDLSKIEDVKHQLGKLYQMKDLRPASSYLGIWITRDQNTQAIWINQQAYIENALKWSKLLDANSTNTPLPAGIHLEKSEEPVALNTKTYYQQIIRTLIYAAIGTKPDIAFAATRLSWFNNNPIKKHIKYAKYILWYLKNSESNMMKVQMPG